MAGPILMTWGPVEFEVWPLNIDSWSHETSAEWAPKEIAGAPTYLEWVGEEPEVISLRGKIFPYTRIGGLYGIDVMERARQAGMAQNLMLGGNHNIGWFICERLTRDHGFVGYAGIGQVVAFEAVFQRHPAQDGSIFFPQFLRLFGGAPGEA